MHIMLAATDHNMPLPRGQKLNAAGKSVATESTLSTHKSSMPRLSRKRKHTCRNNVNKILDLLLVSGPLTYITVAMVTTMLSGFGL